MKRQAPIVICVSDGKTENKSIEDLRTVLQDGWTVASASPLSANASNYSYSLVIVEKDEERKPHS